MSYKKRCLRIKHRKIIVLLSALFLFCFGASLSAREINIPHLTGGSPEWKDYVIIDNLSDEIYHYKIILYKNSNKTFEQIFSIFPYKSTTIDIKSLDFYAECGVILFEDVSFPRYRCRLAYRNNNGGVAEFTLTHSNKSQLSFNFSNNFTDLVQWKGIAIMNSGFSSQQINLYAVGHGGLLASAHDLIKPRSRILGSYTKWFPNIGLNEIESIVVTSFSAPLTGVTISGNYNSSKLLFTPAVSMGTFKDLENSDMQLAKRLFGSWGFLIVGGNSVYEKTFIFPRLKQYINENELEILALSPYLTATNITAAYMTSKKYYYLRYQTPSNYTVVYSFGFLDDHKIQGSSYLYDEYGKLVDTGSLSGIRIGSVYNNNADEDLDFEANHQNGFDFNDENFLGGQEDFKNNF